VEEDGKEEEDRHKKLYVHSPSFTVLSSNESACLPNNTCQTVVLIKDKMPTTLVVRFDAFSLKLINSNILYPTPYPASESLERTNNSNNNNKSAIEEKTIPFPMFVLCFTHLLSNSVMSETRVWKYCTISENRKAKALKLTSVFPFGICLSTIFTFFLRSMLVIFSGVVKLGLLIFISRI
jgi:hypothetical protein